MTRSRGDALERNKIVASAEVAVADIPVGATVWRGGFGGSGHPGHLVQALADRGVRNLTGRPFTDVAPSAWYAPYVSTAARSGIVYGLSPTRFGPNETITREQMAVMLARALKLAHAATLHFTDDSAIDGWARLGVEEAVGAGYIDGFPNGSFQPLGTATRAQAAKVLAMVLRNMAS